MASDLHIHSTASDGTLTPEEIVEESRLLGLKYISITDHDSVGGVESALYAARKPGSPVVIAGVELSVEAGDEDLHILGYFVDHRDGKLLDKLENNSRSRMMRARKIVKNLNVAGVKLPLESVLAISGEGAVGRSHIARALIERGLVSSASEAFEKYLGKQTDFYVNKYDFTAKEIIEIVVEAGGIAVLAHPGTSKVLPDFENLKKAGLKGIEVFHSNHSVSDVLRFKRIAAEYGFLITGGSDSHGPQSLFGRQMGAVIFSDRYVELLIESRERGVESI